MNQMQERRIAQTEGTEMRVIITAQEPLIIQTPMRMQGHDASQSAVKTGSVI